MRTILNSLAGILLCLNIQGQSIGTLGFANGAPGVNAPVFNHITGAKLNASDGIMVGLYFASDGVTNEEALIYAPPPASFLTGGGAGYFIGGTRTLPGTTADTYAMVQVRAWETNYGSNYEQAEQAPPMNGRRALVGKSNLIRVLLGGGARPPGNLIGMMSFEVEVVGGGPYLSIDDLVVAEGTNGTVNAVFTVRLAGPQENPVTVDYATADGTALAGEDYVAGNGTLTFGPGETTRTVTVVVTADLPPEPEEDFHVNLGNAVNAVITKNQGTCIITEARVTGLSLDTAVSINTVAGRFYVLEKTTDLIHWNVVSGGENVPGNGGVVTIIDKGSGCAGVAIYRSRLLMP